MAHLGKSGPIADGEREAFPSAEFVDGDNDRVVMSRQGHLVDLSGALRGARPLLGARRIESAEQAEEAFDSEKGEAGNAGLSRLEVLIDSERW